VIDAAAIDAWLPQTQCTRCGFPDCRSYAEAIARGETGIDRCPPGGEATMAALANLLGLAVPMDLASDLDAYTGLRKARILEHECIGCTKCIEACPVDAIVGSGKMMHTVIEPLCSGCELCLPPCPVDCIVLERPKVPAKPSEYWPELEASAPDSFRRARERHRARGRIREARKRRRQDTSVRDRDRVDMQREIREAVQRAKARRRRIQDS
jgi:electron transport complex protein RnfB